MTLIISLSCKGLPGWWSAANLLQLLSAFTFINTRLAVVSSSVLPDVGIDTVINENYENAVNSFANDVMEKRTWQQLQSAWGKRSSASNNGGSIEPTNDDAILAQLWIPVLTARGGTRSQHHPEALKYSMIYLPNPAALKQLANRHEVESSNASEEDDDKFEDDLFASADQSDHDSFLSEKRNWKSMNAAWGKRRNEPTWNKFRGAWGKREPGWNNLKGMWGKRASKDWQKLHTGWGKRAQETN